MNIRPIMDEVWADLRACAGQGIMTGDPVVSLDHAAGVARAAAEAAVAADQRRRASHPGSALIAQMAATLMAPADSWFNGEPGAAVECALETWEMADEKVREAVEAYSRTDDERGLE